MPWQWVTICVEEACTRIGNVRCHLNDDQFDAAGREACDEAVAGTNTPLQALNLMNDVTFVEAARVFSARS